MFTICFSYYELDDHLPRDPWVDDPNQLLNESIFWIETSTWKRKQDEEYIYIYIFTRAHIFHHVSMLREMMEAKASPYWYHWNKQTMTEIADEIQWRKTHRLSATLEQSLSL